ncbi:uncharacterized protein A4U43_C01F25570 [Asparagus officinalis]|uniref:Uncharacterized protein n=1 Tax=Asparagus officinalis TaxID=4686 RepID=A0A5P1FS28_ASPOF|nr:uncharacterized protein A4U43_C01F25570 [Asparagus officinalis]
MLLTSVTSRPPHLFPSPEVSTAAALSNRQSSPPIRPCCRRCCLLPQPQNPNPLPQPSPQSTQMADVIRIRFLNVLLDSLATAGLVEKAPNLLRALKGRFGDEGDDELGLEPSLNTYILLKG